MTVQACQKTGAYVFERQRRPVEKFESEQIGSYSDKWYLEINAVRYYLFEYGAVDIFAKQRICHNVGYVGERKLVYIVEKCPWYAGPRCRHVYASVRSYAVHYGL